MVHYNIGACLKLQDPLYIYEKLSVGVKKLGFQYYL